MAKNVIAMDLERYVKEMKSRGLFREKKNDYAVMCPNCMKRHKEKGDAASYRKLHLWISKDYQYGQCFRDHTVFVSDNQIFNTNVKRMESPVDMSNWTLDILGEEGYWTLSRFNTLSDNDQIGIDYLASRIYLYRKLYSILNIRFDHNHNPVVPFYYKDQLIYYQIRNKDYVKGSDKPKYFSPPIDHKPPYIIEHGENKKFVICEGTFDAMACSILFPDRTPFAVLGSDITDYEIAMLRGYVPEDILIYMDDTNLSYEVKNKLERYINYAEFNIQKSNGQDPEERLKESFIENL